MEIIDNEISENIYKIKSIAITSVVLAHTGYAGLTNSIAVGLLGRFARMGVFAFFVLSGYLFLGQREKNTFVTFWKRSFFRIIMPWIVSASLIFLFANRYRLDDFQFLYYLHYVIGNGSLFYYMTDLVLFYLFFWFFAENRFVLYLSIIVTVLLTILTASGILPTDVHPMKLPFTYLNPYLNLLNFIGMFAFGCLIRIDIKFKRIFSFLRRQRLVAFVVLALVYFCASVFEHNQSYFSYFGLVSETALFFLSIIVCDVATGVIGIILVFIGKSSFSIFLYHLLLIGSVLQNCELNSFGIILCIIRPILIVCVIALTMKIMYEFLSKIRLEKYFALCTGVRY